MPGGPILVTGATGKAGREVVRALRSRNLPVRAAVHTPEGARAILGAELPLVPLDFRDPGTWDEAVAGCSGVFLVRPPPIANVRETLNPFVHRAREAGAEHMVFLSVAGAGKNSFIPHHKVEAHLRAGSAPYTLLRPGFFAQNLQDAYLQDICADDRLYAPAGDGRAAFIDLHDVAEVAAEAFADPKAHDAKAYTLTGPEALGFSEVAGLLSEALARPIRYVPASIPGYLRHLRRRELSWGQCIVQTILHVGLRRGQAERIDPTLERLLGRPGRTLQTYIGENAEIWLRA